jgi:glycosyltransferase involved in cell wall biosynthesis
MMRIAFLARPESGNGFYRGLGPMAALAERGHRVRQLPVRDNVPQPVGSLAGVEVLHVHRYCDEGVWRIARQAKAEGAAVVWDQDDFQAATPRGVAYEREWNGFAGDRRLTEMRRLWRYVDLSTTPSAQLAEQMARDGAPAPTVIPNYLPDALLRPDHQPHDGVTIGWTAGLEHAADVERLPIVPALQRLLDERDDVNVVSLGLRLGLRSERYVHSPYIPLQLLTRQLAIFDIGIAPLSDILFNRCRSDVKLKEYAAARVPWLASPIGPYRGLGEKQGGRLVPDDRWHEELVRLIEKPKDRQKLAKRASKWVTQQTLGRRISEWEDAFAAAVERSRSAVGATSSG